MTQVSKDPFLTTNCASRPAVSRRCAHGASSSLIAIILVHFPMHVVITFVFILSLFIIHTKFYNKKAAKVATPTLPTHNNDPKAPYSIGLTVKAPAALELDAAAVLEVSLEVAAVGTLERAVSAA